MGHVVTCPLPPSAVDKPLIISIDKLLVNESYEHAVMCTNYVHRSMTTFNTYRFSLSTGIHYNCYHSITDIMEKRNLAILKYRYIINNLLSTSSGIIGILSDTKV